jgi:hypothetical protein
MGKNDKREMIEKERERDEKSKAQGRVIMAGEKLF